MEAGLGIQGQVQCKSSSVVNIGSRENANKQTPAAVTHVGTHRTDRGNGG